MLRPRKTTYQPPKPLTLSVPEAAEYIGGGVGERWVYEAIRRGDLPGVKVGGRWLINRERLEQVLAGQLDPASFRAPGTGPAKNGKKPA